MLLVLAWLALLSQGINGPNSAEVQLHACGFCWGKRIRHTVGTVVFCVPRGINLHHDAGFEGDIRDIITISRGGETRKLIIFSSMNPSGNRSIPSDWFPAGATGHPTVHAWRCSEGDGRDLRIERDGRHWRMIAFPFGYAEYGDVSPNIATRFDRVLDSLCCRPIR